MLRFRRASGLRQEARAALRRRDALRRGDVGIRNVILFYRRDGFVFKLGAAGLGYYPDFGGPLVEREQFKLWQRLSVASV